MPIKLFLDIVPIPNADNVSKNATWLFSCGGSEYLGKVARTVHLSKIHVTKLAVSRPF